MIISSLKHQQEAWVHKVLLFSLKKLKESRTRWLVYLLMAVVIVDIFSAFFFLRIKPAWDDLSGYASIESNPLAGWLLRLPPFIFCLASIFYLALLCILILGLPKRSALIVFFIVFLSHANNALDWIYKFSAVLLRNTSNPFLQTRHLSFMIETAIASILAIAVANAVYNYTLSPKSGHE